MCLVNSHWAQLVLRWVIVSELSSRCRISVLAGAYVVKKQYENFEDYAFKHNGQKQLFRRRHTCFLFVGLVVYISASF